MTHTYASLLSVVKQILTFFLTAPLKIWTLSWSLVPEVNFWILLRNFSVLLKGREAFCLTLSLTFTFCSVFYKSFLHLCNYFILLHFNKISFFFCLLSPCVPSCHVADEFYTEWEIKCSVTKQTCSFMMYSCSMRCGTSLTKCLKQALFLTLHLALSWIKFDLRCHSPLMRNSWLPAREGFFNLCSIVFFDLKFPLNKRDKRT